MARPMAIRARVLALAVALVTGLVVGTVSQGPGASVASASATGSDLQVQDLRVEDRVNPYGVGAEPPRFGWASESTGRGVTQSAYELRVARSGADPDTDPVWSSGRVESDEQVAVRYQGPQLQGRTRYDWQVRVWDGDGRASGWSAPAWFETGVLDASEWTADWISGPDPAVAMRPWTDYVVEASVTVDQAALGLYLRQSGEGDAYMWQLNATGGELTLRPHIRTEGSFQRLAVVPLGDVVGDPAAPIDVRIELDGATITTWIQGQLVDTREDTRLARGYVGLRTAGGEGGTVHELRVSTDEQTLLDTSFEGGDAPYPALANPFSGGTVTDGDLVVPASTEAVYEAAEPMPLLRRDLVVDKEVVRARLYGSALGTYELRLNGEPVGDHELAPGWTDYDTRVQYQTYDVTDLVESGANTLAATLGPGWYAGHIADRGTKKYGDEPALFAQLHLDFADGSSEVIGSDTSWRTDDGPVRYADLIMGERYDATAEQPGWDRPGFDDDAWTPVRPAEPSATGRLVPQPDDPARVLQQRPALDVSEPEPGVFVADLGQNMVGVVRLRASGRAGDVVQLRHAEAVNADGTLFTGTLRGARATDYYTLGADGAFDYTPQATVHGFRYVEIRGVDRAPTPEEVTGLVIGSDLDTIGELETSDPRLNQLQRNIEWGQRGNFLSVPTDTPARDERLGWTGDVTVFAPTASYVMRSGPFLRKWLQDLRDAQELLDNGDYPRYAPYVDGPSGGSAGWGDAGVVTPYTLWQAYGDTSVIDESYDSMRRYVEFMRTSADGFIFTHDRYGDWLHLDDPTPGPVLGTAYFAHSTRLLAEMAEATGRELDAARYSALADDVTAAFAEEFIGPDGSVQGGSQAAHAIALDFDLVPPELVPAVGDRLVERIEAADGHLSTGFLGTPALLPALTASGHRDVAYDLLMTTTMPSWLYQVENGATTLWERWDAILPDGSFNPRTTSLNHYAYGAVGDWMYRTVAGISAVEPGYRVSEIAPQPGGGLTSARGALQTPYGRLSSSWESTTEGLRLDVEVPVGTTARVRVPTNTAWAVREGGDPLADAEGVELVTGGDGEVVVEVGSGRYAFVVDDQVEPVGSLLDAVAALDAVVAGLVADGDLTPQQAAQLTDRLDAVRDPLVRAVQALREDPGADVVAPVADALTDLEQAVAWWAEQDLPPAVREEIGSRLADLDASARDLLVTVAGVEVEVVASPTEVHPGEQVRVGVTVRNGGRVPVEAASAALEVPGWTPRPGEVVVGPLPRDGERSVRLGARVPQDTEPGAVTVRAEVLVTVAGHRLPVGAQDDVQVQDPVTVAVDPGPEPAVPGATVPLSAVVTNASGVAVRGRLVVETPDGWTSPRPGPATVLPRGASRSLPVSVDVPLTIDEGAQAIQVRFERDGVVLGSGAASLDVPIARPPAQALDHVDLGDAISEEAHALDASPGGGTSVEAGQTRRYAGKPVGTFGFDLTVRPGDPFVLVVTETYDDRDRPREYDVVVDGDVVHQRRHPRTGGVGLATYQVLVEDTGSSGTVRVEFPSEVSGSVQPASLADVWAVRCRPEPSEPGGCRRREDGGRP